MANVMKTYLRHMDKKFGYHAIWQPNRQVAVGDVVKMHRGVSTLYTTLEKLGIAVDVRKTETNNSMEYSSDSSVKVETKLHGSTNEAFKLLGEGEAGFVVSFGRAKSIYMKTTEITTHEISNLGEIGSEILMLPPAKWDPEYYIVSEVMEARSGTIIISNSKDSTIEICAKGAAPGAALNIGDSSLDLRVMANIGIETKIVGQDGITPLYKIVQLNKSRGDDGASVSEVHLSKIDMDKD